MNIKVFMAGLSISALGALPLGVLNVTAFMLSAQQGAYAALLFAAGAVLVEVLYLQFTLHGAAWLHRQHQLVSMLQWITVIVFGLMSLQIFYGSDFQPEPRHVALINSGRLFMQGVLLSAINPAQFPFWTSWNLVLISRGTLKPQVNAVPYSAGVGTGTLATFLLFIAAGNGWGNQMIYHERWNMVLGIFYGFCALLALVPIIKKVVMKVVHE